MSIKAIDEVGTEDGFAMRNPQLWQRLCKPQQCCIFTQRDFGELLEFIQRSLATYPSKP
jgi:hypothetical protein